MRYLASVHIPVVSHVGLVPSRATWTGGFRAVSGVIEQVGHPTDLFDDPGNAFVAGFIGVQRCTSFRCAPSARARSACATSRAICPYLGPLFSPGQKHPVGPAHLAQTQRLARDMSIDVAEQPGSTAFVHWSGFLDISIGA